LKKNYIREPILSKCRRYLFFRFEAVLVLKLKHLVNSAFIKQWLFR